MTNYMVKYYGHHGCNQFIRGKPVRFSYKIWSLNTKDGYLVNYEPYQGKVRKGKAIYEQLFGKSASPLLVLLDEIPEVNRKICYNFYMNNLFTGVSLFSFLKYCGYHAIGTIRENRLPKECILENKKLFSKKDWGYFETAIEKSDGLLYVQWLDNSVVTMISSSCGAQEVGQVKIFSQLKKRNIMIPRPKLVAKSSTYMGGTDQMDQNLACYHIAIRSKKWYWCLFTWMLDVAIQNSWILYNQARNQTISQLDFKTDIATVYLQRHQALPKGAGSPSASRACSNSCISGSIRLDKTDHLVQHTEGKKKERCAHKDCKPIVRTMCSKCNVGLCIDCFIPFHVK
ncbi:piggyBac transposable element-derived protein 3-like [Schistocerca serialis cubense]|uniref:piggyBac transposable element-derived protein 3-like n=1 Tax=Schistocerca serialis cubense TaxID=2023355 RepID=UPI00214E8B75|nr:piggyBac transposable element-derived protein 3-like [Schistocerca serialis cubense]